MRCECSATFILLISALSLHAGGSYAISSKGNIRVNVKVPKEAEIGKSVNLECTWKLTGNNTLYSVKWYKDEYEFFSYNPDNNPKDPIKTHAQNGVTIDAKSSSKNLIRLTNLTLNSSGQYKCEVSTGAPYFATNYLKDNLTVIALPSKGPEITGLSSPHYTLGENVTANCTSWPSVPKAQLHWMINDKMAPAKYVVKHPPLEPIESLGIPNSLGLCLEIEMHHLSNSGGMLRLRCVAFVGSQRFEAERSVQIYHPNNQRFSAGDLRSRAAVGTLCSLSLVFLAAVLTT